MGARVRARVQGPDHQRTGNGSTGYYDGRRSQKISIGVPGVNGFEFRIQTIVCFRACPAIGLTFEAYTEIRRQEAEFSVMEPHSLSVTFLSSTTPSHPPGRHVCAAGDIHHLLRTRQQHCVHLCPGRADFEKSSGWQAPGVQREQPHDGPRFIRSSHGTTMPKSTFLWDQRASF